MSKGKKVHLTLFGKRAQKTPIDPKTADTYEKFNNVCCQEYGEDQRKEDVVKEAQKKWNGSDETKRWKFQEEAKEKRNQDSRSCQRQMNPVTCPTSMSMKNSRHRLLPTNTIRQLQSVTIANMSSASQSHK